MLTICPWKWGSKFTATHVNVLRQAFARHLALPHEFVCVTDDARGLDPSIRVVPLPESFRDTPRCRRRMRIFDRAFASTIGRRILTVDLDIVIVGDLTPLLGRAEPLVCWRVAHANVYSGSFVLMDAGVLDPLWQLFQASPEGFPAAVQARGVASDQAMLNWYLEGQEVPHWTERDGFVTFYGAGYERLEHLGVGPSRRALPKGARIVVLGSDDLYVLEDLRYPWVAKHYAPLARAVEGAAS